IHCLAHLLPEACWCKFRGIRRHQPPIKPGRAIGTNLFFELNGRDDTDAGLPVATGIIGRGTVLEILRDAPLVRVDPLDDPCTTQRLQPPDMGIHIALIITARHTARELRLFEMTTWPVNAVLRHRS